MNENDEDVVHPGIVTKSQKAPDSGRFCNSPPTGRPIPQPNVFLIEWDLGSQPSVDALDVLSPEQPGGQPSRKQLTLRNRRVCLMTPVRAVSPHYTEDQHNIRAETNLRTDVRDSDSSMSESCRYVRSTFRFSWSQSGSDLRED
jgi:hypothetical protein